MGSLGKGKGERRGGFYGVELDIVALTKKHRKQRNSGGTKERGGGKNTEECAIGLRDVIRKGGRKRKGSEGRRSRSQT